ncbi:MAG TPA: tetratricopeptide repeat protein [Bryobacteraceae bacterium]|nr:tetratricopeptide repeat protein [Bryobacteraceae bacterium]
MRRRAAVLGLAIIASTVSVRAQQGATASPGAGGTEPIPPARGVFGPGDDVAAPGLATTQRAAVSIPVMLSGKVVVDGGGPPPSPVLIETACDHVQRSPTYTDKKGRFAVNVPQKSEYAEAAIQGDATLHCMIQASLPGYHPAVSEVWSMTDHPFLTLHTLDPTKGTLVSLTELDAPKRAREASERGLAALRNNDWSGAQAEFEKALEIDPHYATAWYELGAAQLRQGRVAQARAAWNKALESDRRFLKPYIPLAELAAAGSRWSDMAAITDRAVALDPVDAPILYLYHAIACFNVGRMDVAEQSSRRAISLDAHHQLPRAEYILGRALAHRADYPGALDHMRRYLQLLPQAPDAAVVRAQIAEAEKHASP